MNTRIINPFTCLGGAPCAAWVLRALIAGLGVILVGRLTAQTFTVLHSFAGSDGAFPYAGLILSGNTLYGTTALGGVSDGGTVFAVNTDGTGFTALYSFTGRGDGVALEGGLILSGDTLYGTAAGGGSSGNGTVFKVNIDGSGFTNLYTFTGGTDGADPSAGLILSVNTLHGTAQCGGSSGKGTVFSISLPVTSPQLAIIPAGANVILTWPTNAAGYTLQSTTNLVAPTVWNTVSPGPVVADGQNAVTNVISGTQQFYRLSQ